ncbi:MAG: adenylate/guanylate cyclase domain-containing protein [Candidatus Rokubacteria bacterium]|nr:adenylate/guanylate cyclase domain-containing protein [Candidatus Rokubacteria bacterium]
MRFTGPRTTRLASYVIALGVSLLALAIWFAAPPLLTRADLTLYDQHFLVRGAREGHPQIAIVAIDEASLRAIGRWPWPRRVIADLVERLDAAGAAAIGVDIIFNEPEQSGELRAARVLRERLGARADAEVRAELDALIRDADHDARFAAAVRASGRAVLPIVFGLAPSPPMAAPERQGQPFKSALASFRRYDDRGVFPPLNADSIALPIPPLLDAAASLGHVNMQADFDGTTRWEALVIEYRGHYYPSLALATVRLAAGIEPFSMKLDFGQAVELGDVAIPIDARARVLVDYAGPAQTFVHYSAADVLAGRVPADRLRGRIVFVGATAEGTYDLRVTPYTPVLPGVEKHANVAANILEGRFVTRPVWVELFEAASILVLPLLLGWVLPRLRPFTSFGVTIIIAALLVAGVDLAFRQGIWLPIVYPSLALGLTFVGVTVFRFLTEERQRMFTKRAFQQYVSPEVVDRIVADPSALQFGGEIRHLTVLFTDIRGFTTFSESHDPHEVVAALREHLTRLTACVLTAGGTLDKYIGDAVMAIFGAPVDLPDHAVRACRAALKMSEAATELNAKWAAEGREPLNIGVGINTGDMVVGNLGSEQVFSYTVTGDAVNLAARAESLNKDYAAAKAIIITESTYEAAKDAIEARALGEVKAKGKTRPVLIYELLAMKSPEPAPTAT